MYLGCQSQLVGMNCKRILCMFGWDLGAMSDGMIHGSVNYENARGDGQDLRHGPCFRCQHIFSQLTTQYRHRMRSYSSWYNQDVIGSNALLVR